MQDLGCSPCRRPGKQMSTDPRKHSGYEPKFMKSNNFFQTANPTTHALKQNDFATGYAEYFNLLRNAAKYNDLMQIEFLKASLTKEQYLMLLHDKNSYSDCAIIHYAAKYNRPTAIQALVEHLTIEERLSIFQIKFDTRCNTLHFTATVNDLDDSNCSFEAAAKIKELLYLKEDHSIWVRLLEEQQYCLETAVHYAARQPTAKLLKLLSDGLDASEWIKIISLQNNERRTAVAVYFINMKKKIDGSHKDYISALQGPLTQESWVSFLVANRLLAYLNPINEISHHCFREIITTLKPELAEMLANSWQQLYPSSNVGDQFIRSNACIM
jgi:hypothetical protein